MGWISHIGAYAVFIIMFFHTTYGVLRHTTHKVEVALNHDTRLEIRLCPGGSVGYAFASPLKTNKYMLFCAISFAGTMREE